MKIISVPNSILLQKSIEVTKVDNQLLTFISQLQETLKNKKDPEGVGLSAPQVGKNWRIFTTLLDKGKGRELTTYINPKITKASKRLTLGPDEKKPFLEGCLSIPHIYGPVWRHLSLKLEFETVDAKTMSLIPGKRSFESFPARVIQHELDHLEGILFTQRALEQNLPLYEEKNGDLVEIAQ